MIFDALNLIHFVRVIFAIRAIKDIKNIRIYAKVRLYSGIFATLLFIFGVIAFAILNNREDRKPLTREQRNAAISIVVASIVFQILDFHLTDVVSYRNLKLLKEQKKQEEKENMPNNELVKPPL